MKKLFMLPAALALLTCWGCKDDAPVAVTGVQLDRPTATICLANTLPLQATVLPDDAADKSVRWTSSDPSVAEVDNMGVVTAGTYGTATISVRTNDGNHSASCVITVPEICVNAEGFSLSAASATIRRTDPPYVLEYSVLPVDAVIKDITVEVTNTKVASASTFADPDDDNKPKVRITPRFGGQTDIRLVAHNGIDTVFHVDVPLTPLTGIVSRYESNKDTVTHLLSSLVGGASSVQKITAYMQPLTADVEEITWETLDADILEFTGGSTGGTTTARTPVISSDGTSVISVLGKQIGNARVKLSGTSNGTPFEREFTVTVDTSYVTSAGRSGEFSKTMMVGEIFREDPGIRPISIANGTDTIYFMTDKTMIWTSSHPDIVEVTNEEGIDPTVTNDDIKASFFVMTAKSPGAATVTGTPRTANTDLSVTYQMTVVAGTVTVTEHLSKPVTFSNAAGNQDVHVESNTNWTAAAADDWCTFSAPGGNGNATLGINVAANTTGRYRRTIVTISGGTAPIELSVQQTAGAVPDATQDNGVVVGGATWATRFVESPGEFAPSPEAMGMLYQWNRKKAWPTVATDISAEGWDTSNDTGTEWTEANDPCPAGWRIPTKAELEGLVQLITDGKSSHKTAETAGNLLAGTFIGDNATDGSIMVTDPKGCLFIPWTYMRNAAGANPGALGVNGNSRAGFGQGGWAKEQNTATNGSYFMLHSMTAGNRIASVAKGAGYPVRCVKK